MVSNFVDIWPIINDILRREGIARQHLNSYNEFMESGLQSIIDEVNEVEIETAEFPYKLKLGKIKLQRPRIMELRWIYHSCRSRRGEATKPYICIPNYA